MQTTSVKDPLNVRPSHADPFLVNPALCLHPTGISALLNFSTCQTSLPTNLLSNFPINVDNLEMQLTSHSNRSKVNYLITGLREGFRIGFHGDKIKLKSATVNCPSANEHPEVIDKYLFDEIQAGRVFGPIKQSPFPYLHTSRFGLIPKKNKPNLWRLILDLSFPLDHSVNDAILKDEFSVPYSKVVDAIRLIVKVAKGALMGKVDVKNAYKIIPIHPADRHLLGIKWRDHYFVDLALSFG